MAATELKPTDPPNDLTPGYHLAWLIMQSPMWVHRRVEALRLEENGRSRWHISHDLTVPPDHVIPGSRGRMVVPLGSLRKGALRNVDTVGPHGGPLSVLGTEDNGDLAIAMLRVLTASLLGPHVAATPRCRRILTDIVYAAANDPSGPVAAFDDWLREQVAAAAEDGDFEQSLDFYRHFVLEFATGFLLLVEVASELAGTRCIIKYSRDDAAPTPTGGSATSTAWEIPDFGFARSYHLEVEVPPGLIYQQLELVELDSRGQVVQHFFDVPGKRQLVAHVACRPGERLATAVAELTLAPSPRGQLAVARYSAWVTFAVVIIAWLASLVPGLTDSNPTAPASAAVSLLLTGPALLLSWFSRSPEHDVVAWVMAPWRRILLWTVVTLFMLAALTALPLSAMVHDLLWFPVLALQSWVVGLTFRRTPR